MIYGVDVSHNNGVLNWTKLKGTGKVQFAVIRICHGLTIDRQFTANLTACKAQKIPYAFYVYAEANTVSGAQAEARFALSKISGAAPLFVAYDAECAALSAQTKNQTTAIADAFLTIVKSSGYLPYVYTNENWRLNEIDVQFLKNKGYGFWYARYTGQTPPAASYQSMCDIWQFSSTGKLAGNGSQYIDLDVCYNAALIARCGEAVNPDYCDTSALTLCPGMTYQFKTGSPVTCASGAFQQIAHSMDGGYHITKFRADQITPGVGFYVNGKRVCVAVVEKAWTDTPERFTKKLGETYQFKANAPITSGNKAIFVQVGQPVRQGKYYFTKFKAVGRGSAGFYVGPTRTNVGTVE